MSNVKKVERSRRAPALMLCTIVAAFSVRLTAAVALSDDVPVPGGTAAFAHALGVDPVPDRGRFLSEISRLVYDNPEGRKPAVEAFLLSLRQKPARGGRPPVVTLDPKLTELVPAPLTADVWGDAIFHRRVARDELVMAIVSDRTATLLCHGLIALDDGTLAYLADHQAILSRLAERAAPAFAAFSSALRIEANRVVPPGGDAAVPLWEAVTLEKVTRVDRFVAQIFELDEGRLAYLYDTIGHLDAPHRAFTLGLWMPNAQTRVDRFKTLATTGIDAFKDWHLRTQPFGRAAYDLSMVLARIQVDETGVAASPGSRGFWSRVYAGTDLPDDGAKQLRGAEEDPIDAAWLLETLGAADVRLRGDRLDQLAFGQRVFAAPWKGTDGAEGAEGAKRAEVRGDAFTALRALPRFRALLFTIERIGVTSPVVYAAAVRHASRLSVVDGRRGFLAQAQLQGSLALVARMVRAHALAPARAQTLIAHLAALPFEDGRYGAGALAAWLRDDLIAALPAGDDLESTVIAAMSGPASGEGGKAARVTWEGQPYRLDLGAAERQRMQRVREKQQTPPLDIALDVAAAGSALAGQKLSLDEIQSTTVRLRRHAANIAQRSRQEDEEDAPAGVAPPPPPRDTVQKSIDELTKAVAGKDLKRASRAGEPLLELSSDLLAQSLLSLVYAAYVGDPDGTILLAGDVSHRHDFGFGIKDTDHRQRTMWSVPRAEVSPNVPWHVTGSLLGLDVALAPLALRRLNYERVLEAPRLTSNERDVFAASVSLMNPFALRDADRAAIVAAVTRGRGRVRALAASAASAIDPLADEIGMERARRRALAWTLAHEPGRTLSMFTLTELLVLGGGRPGDFDAWGMVMMAAGGCACSRLAPPGQWPALAGRPQLGLTASAVADVNLHIALTLNEMGLPAALTQNVLAAAMQDFIDEVRPSDDGDWLTMARTALTLSRERVEDYVAAATAGGPLMPGTDGPGAP
ncbi:MAG: hypothetical protein HY048_01085 [Acidobacteria bacterium]|nr:hypothetical protein [Acidobacteriota bacterium]